jgi:hypothetical protein
MEKITYRTLTADHEINLYLERFGQHVKVRLPYDYINRAQVVGAFRGEELVAGYMLVTRPAFRSLMFVPDEVRQQHEFFKNDEYEMMEVNALWIGAGVRSVREQFGIWMHMLRDVFSCRKKYVLLMADIRNSNICQIHQLMGKQEIYQGAPLRMVGAETHNTITVGYTTRWQLLRNLPAYLGVYRERQRRARRSAGADGASFPSPMRAADQH